MPEELQKKVRILLPLLLGALTSAQLGCANIWGPPAADQNSARYSASSTSSSATASELNAATAPDPLAPVPKGELKRALRSAANQTTTTELYWQVPADSVEWYHIQYGPTPQELGQVVAIKTVDLEKLPSAEYGAVFRYRLNVPSSQPVYVSIVGENRYGKSPNSQLIKITNGKQELVK